MAKQCFVHLKRPDFLYLVFVDGSVPISYESSSVFRFFEIKFFLNPFKKKKLSLNFRILKMGNGVHPSLRKLLKII